jgi:pimeloyl-ACP methyl ester carboxylesterase
MVVVRTLLMAMLMIMGLLAVFQRRIMYPASQAERLPVAAFPETARLFAVSTDVVLQTSDGTEIRGWYLRADADQKRRLMVLFHGNGGHRAGRTGWYQLAAALQCDVLAVDYHGYGDSGGSPTEQHLIADAHAAWQHAIGPLGYVPEQIVICGESLGGGVAVRLAADVCRAEQRPKGLLLIATFDSMVNAAGYHFPWLPVGRLVLDRYHSDQHIADVTCRIMQYHGDQDTVVPLPLGQRLHQCAREVSADGIPKQFHLLRDSGHNGLMRQHAERFQRDLQLLFGDR